MGVKLFICRKGVNFSKRGSRHLDQLFLKLAMHLNLCKPQKLQMCRVRGCSLLELIASFFEVNAEQEKKCVLTGFSRSISMQREVQYHNQQFTKKRRGSVSVSVNVGFNRRVSFGFQEPHRAVATFAQ